MQRAVQTALFTLLFLVIFCVCAERYTMLNRNYDHSLDSAFSVHRLSNDRKQTKDPFNTCSPESYDECAKNAMPHLSRY
jgi:hypothetical protein